MTGLRSGNGLYDAELLRRIDARRFPTATRRPARLRRQRAGGRYQLEGALTFHGVTGPVLGAVEREGGRPTISSSPGEQSFDIRDFAIPSPTVLMLRIYPDVRVRLQAEAEWED